MKTLTITLGSKKKKVTEKITDLVKTFEDACQMLGIDESFVIEIGTSAKELEGDLKSIEAYCKLIIIVRALNQGWIPDWNNSNEYKWYPWFMHKSGLGLSFDGGDRWHTATCAGPRLCFKTKELAEYAGKQFEEIYRDFLTL